MPERARHFRGVGPEFTILESQAKSPPFGGSGPAFWQIRTEVGRPELFSATLSLKLFHQDIGAAVSRRDDEVHENEHQFVVPAGGLLAPESGVPAGNLSLDSAEHDQDESESGELGENSSGDAQTSGEFRDAEEDGERFWHLDALGTGFGVLQVAVSAGDEI